MIIDCSLSSFKSTKQQRESIRQHREMILTSKFSEELNDTLRNWLAYRIMKMQNKEPQQVDGIFRKYFETAIVIIDAQIYYRTKTEVKTNVNKLAMNTKSNKRKRTVTLNHCDKGLKSTS